VTSVMLFFTAVSRYRMTYRKIMKILVKNWNNTAGINQSLHYELESRGVRVRFQIGARDFSLSTWYRPTVGHISDSLPVDTEGSYPGA
jgi:hypothetical protein